MLASCSQSSTTSTLFPSRVWSNHLEELVYINKLSSNLGFGWSPMTLSLVKRLIIIKALFQIKYYNLLGYDNTCWMDLAKEGTLSYKILTSSSLIIGWARMLSKSEGSMLAYVGGVSPIIFILGM